MKTLKILFIFILLASFANICAQVDDNTKSDKKHKHKKQIKVKIHDLPNEMTPGSSADVTVTVTNKSKSNGWEYSGRFTCTVEGPFTFVTSTTTALFTLNPGESKDLIYKLTAPTTEGSHKASIVFFDGDKKVGSKTKLIRVYSTTSDEGKK